MVDTIGDTNAVASSPTYSGRMLRQSRGVYMGGATPARPLGARSGVRPGTSAATVTVSGLTWTCGPFAGLADVESAAEAGAYPYSFDASTVASAIAAQGGNARSDLIVVQVDDPSEDGTSAPAVRRAYVQGGTSGPADPTLPARSYAIARINVPASGGGSPTVTWIAPYAVAAGGRGQVNTFAQITTQFLSPTQGDQVYALDSGVTYQYYAVYNGSTNPQGAKTAGWYPRPGEQVGGWVVATSAQALAAGAQVLNGAYPATPDEVSGGVTWNQTTGEFTAPFEGEWDVYSLIAATPATYENQIWVAGVQVATVLITNGPLMATVKTSAGDKITHRTFTSGTGAIGTAGGRTQFSVKWRGVRHL